MAVDVRSIYVTALKNAHAVELQALQIMERQVERLERYPEMERPCASISRRRTGSGTGWRRPWGRIRRVPPRSRKASWA